MGLDTYEQVLNNLFYINENGSLQTVRILSIVDDFFLADRDEAPSPLIIFIQDGVQRYAAIKLNNLSDLGTAEKILKYYHISPEQIKSVRNLHQEHFNNENLIKNTINTVTSVSIVLIIISTVIVSMAEAKRLNKTLQIMESIGGSIYTNIIFFIQHNLIHIIIAAGISLPISLLLLRHWLNQYHWVTGVSYIYATSALFSFILSIIVMMTITLIFSNKILKIGKNK